MIGILNLVALNKTTFHEVPIQIIIDAVPLDLGNAIITMEVKKDACSTPVLSLTSVGNAGITITDAVDGWFKINQQLIDLKPCNYQYDVKINIDGVVDRYFEGLFQVVTTITN